MDKGKEIVNQLIEKIENIKNLQDIIDKNNADNNIHDLSPIYERMDIAIDEISQLAKEWFDYDI